MGRLCFLRETVCVVIKKKFSRFECKIAEADRKENVYGRTGKYRPEFANEYDVQIYCKK